MLRYTINGETRRAAQPVVLSDLIEEMGFASRKIAVEYNRTIIPKSQLHQVTVGDGDEVEIVVAVGGG